MSKKFVRGKVYLLLLVLISTTIFGNMNIFAVVSESGMRDITALEVTKEMKIGWNLGNTMDSHSSTVAGLSVETCWGNPKTTKAMIDEVKEMGFNTVRIPVTWAGHVSEAPDYTIDPAWMNRVEEIVNYVLDNGMYAILNLHHEENTWLVPTKANQEAATAEITKLWEQIGTRFKDYSDYLIFEVMNEPRVIGSSSEWSGGTTENRTVINSLNLAAVNTIRATGGNNGKRFIMCPTHAACTLADAMKDYVVPNDDSRVIVSLHMYSPYLFAMVAKETASWGTSSEVKSLSNELDNIYNKFVKNGRAVVIGEFGTIDKNNLSSRVTHAGYYALEASKRGIPVIWWDNGYYGPGKSDSYALLNRSGLTWYYPEIAQALVDGANGIAPSPIASSTASATPTTSISPSVTPAEGEMVLDDFEGKLNWFAYSGSDATADAKSTTGQTGNGLEVTYAGAEGGGYWGVASGFGGDWSAWSNVAFDIKGLDSNEVRLLIVEKGTTAGTSGESWEYTVTPDTSWQKIEIPFSSFTKRLDYQPADQDNSETLDLNKIVGIQFIQANNNAGDFTIDNVKLVGKTGDSNTPTSTPTNTPVKKITSADINGDLCVNMVDVMLIAKHFNTVSSDKDYDAKCDLNNDGAINMKDVIIIAVEFNTVISTASPSPTIKPNKICALTFDDGPDATLTPLVLDKLDKYNVPGTFFMVGPKIDDTTSGVVKRIVDSGYEIGNHSWSHQYMNSLSETVIKKEIDDTNAAILKYSGTTPKFFRPPYIAVNSTMFNAIDLTFISGIAANDWDQSVDAKTRADLIINNISDGTIILLHDVQPLPHPTPEALDIIIPALKSQGYEFVTLSELFERKGVALTATDSKIYTTVN